jgi:uncharacterized protein (TIGR00369 family)
MMGRRSEGHCSALNIDMVGCGVGWAEMSLAPTAQLIGDPISGALHTGPITTLLDSALGIAASVSLNRMGFAPTIDLRVDHLRVANSCDLLVARGEIVHLTRNILFAKGVVTQNDVQIAVAVGNFVRLSDEVLALAEAHIMSQLDAIDEARQ